MLVHPAVFKTDVTGIPRQAGSIPVRLRHLLFVGVRRYKTIY